MIHLLGTSVRPSKIYLLRTEYKNRVINYRQTEKINQRVSKETPNQSVKTKWEIVLISLNSEGKKEEDEIPD